MPTYDYECSECGHRFEYFQKMSESPLQECESCSGPVRRLLSGGSGLIFKGSGFYITDYARKNGAGSSNGTAADSSKTKATSTESKKSE